METPSGQKSVALQFEVSVLFLSNEQHMLITNVLTVAARMNIYEMVPCEADVLIHHNSQSVIQGLRMNTSLVGPINQHVNKPLSTGGAMDQ